MSSFSTNQIPDLTDSELIRLHWKSFGIWMGMRARAKKADEEEAPRAWGKVHRYAERVLDPYMLEMERRGIDENTRPE